MTPQWLEMRIQEEQDRRRKEARTQQLLPQALEGLHSQLAACVARYKEAFGPESAEISSLVSKLRVVTRDEQGGKWQPHAKVDITLVSLPPSFKIESPEGEPLIIEIGVLSGDRFSFKLGDQFLTDDDVSRHILDRLLFPKLVE
jgi:hypothetical protein